MRSFFTGNRAVIAWRCCHSSQLLLNPDHGECWRAGIHSHEVVRDDVGFGDVSGGDGPVQGGLVFSLLGEVDLVGGSSSVAQLVLEHDPLGSGSDRRRGRLGQGWKWHSLHWNSLHRVE